MTTILVVDNYDSFVFNLVQYLEQLGADCIVRRNDAVTTDEVTDLGVDGVLLSPGPGTPTDAGVTEEMVRWAAGRLPVFGVCLGHQAIAEVYGAVVDRAEELLHGRTSLVEHTGIGVLAGMPDPFTATRYHSLAVVDGTVPAELRGDGPNHRWGDHGGCGTASYAIEGRAVPPGVGAHPGWPSDARELARDLRR